MSTTGQARHGEGFASLRVYEKLVGPAEVIVTGLLWLVCCVPVLTAGSATIALFRLAHRRLLGTPVPPLKEFAKELRTAPVARCGATLVALLATWGVVLTAAAGASLPQRGLGTVLVLVACIGGACLLGVLSTFFAIAAIFPDRSCWEAWRMAVAVAMTQVSTPLTTSVLVVAVVISGVLFPPLLAVVGPVWAALTVRIERQTLTRICRSVVDWSEEPGDENVQAYYRPPVIGADLAGSR